MDLIKTHVGMGSYNFIRRTTQYFIFNGDINYTGSSFFNNSSSSFVSWTVMCDPSLYTNRPIVSSLNRIMRKVFLSANNRCIAEFGRFYVLPVPTTVVDLEDVERRLAARTRT